jgi:hypothetical protein
VYTNSDSFNCQPPNLTNREDAILYDEDSPLISLKRMPKGFPEQQRNSAYILHICDSSNKGLRIRFILHQAIEIKICLIRHRSPQPFADYKQILLDLHCIINKVWKPGKILFTMMFNCSYHLSSKVIIFTSASNFL